MMALQDSMNVYIDRNRRERVVIWGLAMLMVALSVACVCVGSVNISLPEIWKALSGQLSPDDTVSLIVIQSRIPAALTALLAGGALGLAGLLLQTVFANPLAGPSVLGVSTGASLGVAVVLLAFGGTLGSGMGMYFSTLGGAMLGAGAVMLALVGFSRFLHSSLMLLITGIMVGYIASSAISILNFYATQEGVHSFVIWGLGSFTGVTLDRMAGFAVPVAVVTLWAMLLPKPLDALLLGEDYASNLGVDVRRVRTCLLVISGLLTALVTAYCGPIGFLGLVAPHVARLLSGSSRHAVLLPATFLSGAVMALFCQFLSVLPSGGVMPVNAITPLLGAPLIIYIIVNRRHIVYLQ